MRNRWGAVALVATVAVLGPAVFATAGGKKVVRDRTGDQPEGIRSLDIVKTTARAGAKSVKFTVMLAASAGHTKAFTSIRLKGKPGGNYYLNVTNYGDGGTSKEWRPYDYAKSRITKKGRTVSFVVKLRKIGNPETIRWVAVAGKKKADYAPNKGFAKLKVG